MLPDVVEAVVDLNALQPVADRGLTLESAKAEIGFYEYFLGEVFGVDGVAREIAAIGEDAPVVLEISCSKARRSPSAADTAA